VVRCLALAMELRDHGAWVRFICREHNGNLILRIENEGFRVARLRAPPASGTAESADYAAWLGVSQEEDARDTAGHLREEPVEWVVVDHYGLDHDWEQQMRAVAKRILVIDDLANRCHECDVLVDQNYFSSATRDRYNALVERSCVQLLGPEFALLQPDYRALRRLLPVRGGLVTRVLVFFGGSDLPNDTVRVLEALSCVELGHLTVDVVVGQNHPDTRSLQDWVRGRRGAALHSGLPSLAGLMARADLAVGGGGSTTWERACLALPSLVVTLADNQKDFSTALAADGYQVLLGANTDVSVNEWRAALIDLVGNPDRLVAMSQRSASLTDGFGAERVATAMLDDKRLGHTHGTAESSARLLRIDDRQGAWPSAGGLSTPAETRAMQINVLSDTASWLNYYLAGLVAELRRLGHSVHWSHEPAAIVDGDVCFIIGCSRLVDGEVRRRNKHNLVVHESALPKGRGWSPMTWQVLEDRRSIVVTLFEADDMVDAGRIHLQTVIELTGCELVDEWRDHQACATIELCRRWINEFPDVIRGVREQTGTPSFYRRRRPIDSKFDPNRPLSCQFDLLRTVDNRRYPAFFEYRGAVYRLLIERDDPQRVAKLSVERS
jgi:UDP-2,4-diacetamido-2,4,6-trideoxy-beta-L-altropyranose hydrolase